MVVKKVESPLTNLFGEKIDSFETPAYERMEPRADVSTPEKKTSPLKQKAGDKEKEKEDEGKKALDMWDIPTFLRKKKK